MSIFEPAAVTAAEVREYCEKTGAFMWDAKAHFQKRNRQAAFRLLMAIGTTEEKLAWLLARYAEDNGLEDSG